MDGVQELESDDDEIYFFITNRKALGRWVYEGGWRSVDHFLADTGASWGDGDPISDIKGRWFTVVGGRLFMMEE